MYCHGMDQLSLWLGVEQIAAELVDQAHAELYVPEQLALACGREAGRALELGGSSDVMEKCGCDYQIRPQPRVKLTEITTHRGHRHCVLEQPAGIPVVTIRRRGQSAIRDPQTLVGKKA